MVTLYVTMGMPGSGKTSWCADNSVKFNAVLLSSDAVRTDGVDIQHWFVRMHRKAADHLAAGRSVVIDACNVTADQRSRWRRLAHDHGAQATLVVIDTPAALAVERNAARPLAERVPHDRMLRYAEQFAWSKIAARGEAWDETIVVQLEQSTTSRRPAVVTSRAW